MFTPDYLILYVAAPLTSAEFYQTLLQRPPVETSPGFALFALFALDHGRRLGLWARDAVQPSAVQTGGGCELAFPAPDRATVDTLHADWRARGLPVLQAPTDMDFGYTFTAADPDGHRLRVFHPGAPS